MILTASGLKLAERIKQAIEKSFVTRNDYEEILNLANEDGRIDTHERVLLREFNNLIAQRVVSRSG